MNTKHYFHIHAMVITSNISTVGFIEIATIEGSIIEGEGDFVATFSANNTPIRGIQLFDKIDIFF